MVNVDWRFIRQVFQGLLIVTPFLFLAYALGYGHGWHDGLTRLAQLLFP